MSRIFNILLLCLLHTFHCSNGEWVENKGLWYYISRSEQHVGYEKAVDMCDTLNARLAVITSWDKNEFLKMNITDGKYRWIGLSKAKTDFHKIQYCENDIFVWNKDIYCDINDTPSNLLLDIGESEQLGCSGVTFRNGIWTAKDCVERHGFICQWECKRIYMHFEDIECSGVYIFDSYYNNHLDYYKEWGKKCRMYRSMSQGKWAVTKKDEGRYFYQYFHDPDLYVPYTKEMSWKDAYVAGKDIRAGSFCIECDHLNVCLYGRQGREMCYNDLRLTNMSSYPTYIYNDNSAVITYKPDLDQPCIGIESIGHKCRYLFLYPKKTTIYTFENNDSLSYTSITNMCIRGNIEMPVQTTVSLPSQTSSATQTIDVTGRQSSIDKYTTSTYETTSKSPSAQKSTEINTIITLSVSIAGVVIVIIIVAVIVSIIFVRRRKRKGQNDEDPGGINRNAQNNANVYLELPESKSKRNVEDLPDKDCDGGEYSYADFATHGARQASTEVVKISRSEEKQTKATNNEFPKEYLAPDYGVITDTKAKQTGKGQANSKQETITFYLEISNTKTKSISHSPEKSDSDYDLQLHENEVYDASDGDNKEFNNPQDHNGYYDDVGPNAEHGINPQTKLKQHSDENCPYQNAVSDSTDEGDDNLELFENSVYEHTQ